MCGIAGIFNLNGEPVSPVLLRKMTDVIAHRGPDGEGFYTDSFIGLGHRRLAIIDLLMGDPIALYDHVKIGGGQCRQLKI
jgi:asparagine synthetase B (glutamine-hydrolysing)